MATRDFKSDIIIAIHPEHVANIVLRVKNHEFRKYLLPPHIVKGQKRNSEFATMLRFSHRGCSDNYASQPRISPALILGCDIA